MDFDPFKKKITELNKLPPAVGNILVAEPFMKDDYFKRAVIYICENNDNGTVGFILNAKLELNLTDVLDGEIAFDSPLYMGGPVEAQSLFFIHQCADLKGALLINNGIYWSGDFEQLKEFMLLGKIRSNEIRFFLGYSGWDKTQLKNELKSENWLIGGIEKINIFSRNNNNLWKNSLMGMGQQQALMANFPNNPSLN